ncbi:hypothetical protein [Paracoccus yeei]|uniref:hypothetical protein n=1 Tax=Paracoccus yeei TaxID=147645 RepID=UPI0028D8305D|nr:hypothetical protein [Paracoccus yeei]
MTRYEPHCDCLGGHVSMVPDPNGRWCRADATPRAWLDVFAERRRQISGEGWTLEHDDQHDDGELAAAGATYALSAANCIVEQPFHRTWPWQKAWWKPTEPRRDLVKAGALILAEIERLDRAALSPETDGGQDDR